MTNDSKTAETAASRFSLHRLSAAFARLTGVSEAQSDSAACSEPAGDVSPIGSPPSESVILSPRLIVEGMLFVGHADGRPLTNRMMAAHIRDVSPQEVDTIIAELNTIYEEHQCCYQIVSDGEGYRMQLRLEHEALSRCLSGRSRQAKLTPQAVEVLSVVAYRQPIAADEVTKVRGSRSDALLNQLIRRGLLKLERAEGHTKPFFYTTERFNQLLNINSPAELPHSEDLDDN